MHWLYNDGTAVDVSDWALPASEWERWAARSEAGTLHTGMLITPLFVRRWETDRTIPGGHIGSVGGGSAGVHNDWSWVYVEMLAGSVDPDGVVVDAAPWTVYVTSCMEEGFPALTINHGWTRYLPTGFVPEASDSPVWAWPGPLSVPYVKDLEDGMPGPAGRGGPGGTIPTTASSRYETSQSCHPPTARE